MSFYLHTSPLWLLSYEQQSLAYSNMCYLLWSHFEYRFVFFIIIIIVLTQNLVVVVDVIGLMRRKPDLTWLFLVHTEKIYENLPTLKDVEGPG